MSWSVSVIGKAKAVAKRLASDLERQRCSEPEETIKKGIGQVVSEALESFADDVVVQVTASGSQYNRDGRVVGNQLRVEVTPLYGFLAEEN